MKYYVEKMDYDPCSGLLGWFPLLNSKAEHVGFTTAYKAAAVAKNHQNEALDIRVVEREEK